MARYRKIDPRVWNDEKFLAFSDDGKLAFLFVLTHPSMTAIGAMRATEAGLAAELGWPSERLSDAIGDAIRLGLVDVNRRASFVGARNFLRYNEPEGPNSVSKAWLEALDLIPECKEKRDLISRCRAYLDGRTKAFRDALPDAIWDAFPHAKADASRIQEQEQEQEQEPKAAAARARGRAGAKQKSGSGAAEGTSPPPVAEAAPEPNPSHPAPLAAPHELEAPPQGGPVEAPPPPSAEQASDLNPGTAGPVGAPPDVGTPPFDPTPAAVGHPAEAATPSDPTPRRLVVVDTVELGPQGAQLRAELERAAEWRFIVAAPERKDATRTALEAAVGAVGLDRAVELCSAVLARRKRQGLPPPKAMAFWVPLLEEAAQGGNPCPPEIVGVDLDQVAEAEERERAGRWVPLLERMPPSVREAFEADKARMLATVRALGLWTSEERRQLEQAEEFLWTKWSKRLDAAGGA